MINRSEYMRIAKAIRDSGLSRNNRIVACRALMKVLRECCPTYNEHGFRAMCNAEPEDEDD